jgi:hypothetical protein
VCRIYRIGTLNPDPKAKKNLSAGAKSIGAVKDSEVVFRRPFGCGVLNLANAEVHQGEHGKEVETTMMLFKVKDASSQRERPMRTPRFRRPSRASSFLMLIL